MALLPVSAAAAELRVCADPNNMPFSNERQDGLENRIVALVADELGLELQYVWWAQRRGLVAEALNGGVCDLIAGMGDVPGVLLTYPPYYRSAYVFVTRSTEPAVGSFDDPVLRRLKVGVPLIAGGSSTPPATALARRGIIENVRGYPVLGDHGQPDPAARIVKAVAAGEIDVAVLWGPTAGFFAARQAVPLTLTPGPEQYDTPELPMAFNISMALRLDEGELRQRVERVLRERKPDIDAILAEYNVPRFDEARP